MQRTKLLIHLKSSLWFVPVLCVLAGAALSFGTIALDRYFDYEALSTRLVGGPDAAAYILSTVAASMVSLTALVLTITMVVVQLAMGQFSPASCSASCGISRASLRSACSSRLSSTPSSRSAR